MVYENGDIYEGDFSNGMKQGQGIYRYRNGDTYEGRFVDDKKND